MPRMIACCGLVCSNCPAFLATQNDDDAAREKTGVLYAKKFGFNLKPEHINCDGCLTVGGRQIGYCQVCKIRECCNGRNFDNCALCPDQPCAKLVAFHDFSAEAKFSFEALKKEII